MSLWINDAGTWRQMTNVNVNDAGTWRALKSLWVNDAGTWRNIFTARAAESGSLTAGGSGNGVGASNANFGNGIYGSITGFATSSVFLTDNTKVVTLEEDVVSNVTRVRLSASSSGNLGQNYFSSVTINGNTILSSAATFTYLSPNSLWTWSGRLWGITNGNTYSVTFNF